ncbi:MAG: hypothetical protein ACPG6X_03865 [Synechococcus sp.]
MSTNRQTLLLAYRWPIAVVISSLGLSAVLLKLLSEPIPIRIDGGLQVDKLVMPASITIRSDQPLPVSGQVDVATPVVITGEQPLAIRGPVRVQAIDQPVAIQGSVAAEARVSAIDAPVEVRGTVTVSDTVTVGGKVKVEGKVGADVKPHLLPLP